MDYRQKMDLIHRRILQISTAVKNKTTRLLKGKGNLFVRILDKNRVYLQNNNGFRRIKDVNIACMVLENFEDTQWVIRALNGRN